MIIEAYNEKSHYPIIQQWVKLLKQVCPPAIILPEGVMIKSDDEYLGCGFVYTDECTPLAVISWLFVNPDTKPSYKLKCLRMALNALEYIAKDKEKEFIMADTFAHGIYKVLEKQGYTLANAGAYHCIKVVGGVK